MKRICYFAVIPQLPGRAPNNLHYADEKNELFLGPHVRLSGLSSMAYIETESLARQYAEGCVPIFQKRYGGGASLEVILCEATECKGLIKKIAKDSEIIRKRIATGNFVSNKPPS